jgi:lipopolysaccharide transport system ATP-binding protein
MPPIIEVQHLGKRYSLGAARAKEDSLRAIVTEGAKSAWRAVSGSRASTTVDEAGSIWSLRDINFEVNTGDVLGIVGVNGAGKSTLLKILSRITEPTEGLVKLRGRMASLLEVGTGFHPDLTGRENIFLNGVMLGMTRQEVQAKFDEIVAFAELEKFLDTQVKHYSSGMYVRLGFAVAAHLEPEILVVDEVLAVGDMAFQKKCLGKMSEFGQGGRTVLFVSHNMAAVENLCHRGLVLHKGQMVLNGTAKDAVQYYVHNIASRSDGVNTHKVDLRNAPGRRARMRQSIQELALYSEGDRPVNGLLPIGSPLKMQVKFNLPANTPDFDIRVNFLNLFGQLIFTARSSFEPNRNWDTRSGPQTFTCDIPTLCLTPGEYRLDVALVLSNSLVDYVEAAIGLTVIESDFYGTGQPPNIGLCVMEHHWTESGDSELGSSEVRGEVTRGEVVPSEAARGDAGRGDGARGEVGRGALAGSGSEPRELSEESVQERKMRSY